LTACWACCACGLSTSARDASWQAIHAGCVPLFLRYSAHAGGEACETWSWDARNKSAMRPVARVTIGYDACTRHMLPYWSTVDWDAISVRIDASALWEARLAEAILALDRRELERKRQRLTAARHYFVYDWSGSTYDAFSAMMHDVCKALPARPVANSATRRHEKAAREGSMRGGPSEERPHMTV
jgi:hypothetical protein